MGDVTIGWSRRGRLAAAVVLGAHLVSIVAPAHAQQTQRSGEPQAVAAAPTPGAATVLTLEDALRLAKDTSEQVDIAVAGVTRAEAARQLARSARLPQLDAAASYDRALKSEFEGLFDVTTEPCIPLQVDPTAPLEDRVAELERAYRLSTIGRRPVWRGQRRPAVRPRQHVPCGAGVLAVSLQRRAHSGPGAAGALPPR